MSARTIPRAATDDRLIDRLLNPVHQFLRIEAAGGILLLGCTLVALVWANSPWAAGYEHFWHSDLTVSFGDRVFRMSLGHFVNDGLMAIFFFVVGLEIKRELLVGELASLRKASVPIAAAIGGMLAPALIYVIVIAARGGHGYQGWAVPMATDIAFALGVMAMLGRRVPLSLKVFLTALAIVDDIGAVIVIALFYTSEISFLALGLATGMIVVSAVANRLGVRTPLVYAGIGLVMWLLLLQSGVHATIGGVLLALTIPASMRIKGTKFSAFARSMVDTFDEAGGHEKDILTNPRRQSAVGALQQACEHVQTPLNRLEHGLHPWVAFTIMPIFALANAGINLGAGFGDAAGSGIGVGVALGLLLGKPLGVCLATFIAVKAGLGPMPEGATWRMIIGTGFLAGIGFTMSLFIANLGFGAAGELQLAKTGILAGSLIAGVIGFVVLRAATIPPAGRASDS